MLSQNLPAQDGTEPDRSSRRQQLSWQPIGPTTESLQTSSYSNCVLAHESERLVAITRCSHVNVGHARDVPARRFRLATSPTFTGSAPRRSESSWSLPSRPLDIAAFFQALTECSETHCGRPGRPVAEKSDRRHARLLRPRRKWPSRRAAEKRDEVAPPHYSITSSARPSSPGGTSMRSARAV